jgi:hypothetical protein
MFRRFALAITRLGSLLRREPPFIAKLSCPSFLFLNFCAHQNNNNITN